MNASRRLIAGVVFTLSALMLSAPAGAQSPVSGHLEIPLGEIRETAASIFYSRPLKHKDGSPLQPGESVAGDWYGLSFEARRLEDPPSEVEIRLDTDNDGEFDGPPLRLSVEQPAQISLKCRFAGKPQSCPLTLKLQLSEEDQTPVAVSRWHNYAAYGRLETADCTVALALHDFSADGTFSLRDLQQGTALGLDIDGDGRFYGTNEHAGTQAFFACGQVLTVEDIDAEKGLLRLARLNWPLPKAGESLGELVFQLRGGGELKLADLQGRWTVLDFWATWCSPCVASLPHVQQLQQRYSDRLRVVGITLDDRPEKEEEILQQAGVSFTNHTLAKGVFDTAYQVVASIHIGVPLYVVLDEDSGFIAGPRDTDELAALLQERLGK